MATLNALRDARDRLGLNPLELWLAYFEVGGNRDAAELTAYFDHDTHDVDPTDHDHIIDAINDTFVERGLDHPLAYGTD